MSTCCITHSRHKRSRNLGSYVCSHALHVSLKIPKSVSDRYAKLRTHSVHTSGVHPQSGFVTGNALWNSSLLQLSQTFLVSAWNFEVSEPTGRFREAELLAMLRRVLYSAFSTPCLRSIFPGGAEIVLA